MSYSEPPPPPPPQYGAPVPPAGGMPPQRSGLAVAGLVLGIVGAVPCFWGCFIPSVLGIVFGLLGKKDIRDSQGAKTGDRAAQWGVILGVVGIVVGALYWIAVGAGWIDINYTGSVG